MGYEPLTEATAQDTPLREAPPWAHVPRPNVPRPKPKPSSEPRTVELREPGDAQEKLRGALERLGVREAATDRDVVDLVEGS